MQSIGRRGILQFFLAAGVTAVTGAALSRVEAATHATGIGGGQALAAGGVGVDDTLDEAGDVAEAFESAVEPTQSIVIRPGGRRGMVVRPRPRPWRRPRSRMVCTRRRNGRLVCVRRF